MSENKYLDYEGLKTFKNKLDSQRLADKIEIVETLNDVGDSIKDGKLTIQRNGVIIAEFTANLVGSVNANILVPTTLSDLNNTVEYITNIIKYGQPDVSELTEELKEALHELFTENSGVVSESELESTLTNYGTIINYDSARQYIQLKNGNTILSEFNAADFIKDNMVESVNVSNGNLVITFNTESGLEDILLPISEIFNASNYYTKNELASVATSGNYSDLNGTPGTLTQNDVNTGTDTTGKLISAKVISDSINNALYGQGGSSSTVITTSNLESEALSSGFAKSIMTGKSPNTSTYNADANGVIYFPTLLENDIKNIIKYGLSDISGMTAEERAQAEENNKLAKLSDLASVATSGSYNDLTDKPSIPNGQLQSDWNLTNTLAVDYIKNKPIVYSESEIKNIIKYGLVDVSEMTESEKEQAQNDSEYALKSDLFSGSYNDLTNKPSIPNAQILSDWNLSNNLSLDYIKNKPTVYTLLDIQNIIKYGLADITGMSESEKEAAQNSSEYALKSDLANFVSNENSILYLSNEKIKNIILGNESVLSLSYLGIQLNDDFFDFNGDGTINVLETSNDLLPYALGFINDYARKYYNKESNFENIQSDWNETNTEALSHILNKPTVYNQTEIENIIKYGQPDISELTPQEIENAEKNSSYATKNWINDKIDDILGINAEEISTLTNILSDNDKTTGILSAINSKVDKVEGKGLSTNDFTTALKNKLDNIEAGALVNVLSDWNATNGDAVILNKPTSLPASDVSDWAKESNKPSYNLDEISDGTNRKLITNYGNLNYTGSSIISEGGQVSIDGSNNIFKITTSANISGITLTSVPENYHSCHVIIRNSSSNNDVTITISNTATVTIDDVVYSFICPEGDITLDIAKNSNNYVEFDILRLDNELYIRGV